MLFKCILIDTEFKTLIEISEKIFSFLIGLFDNNRILIPKIPDIGEGGTEHGVG